MTESLSLEALEAAARAATRWGQYVNRRLDAIASGDGAADWEEETGDPYPTPERVERARAVANQWFRVTTPTPSVVPGDDGAVEFVWHKNQIDVWLEVGADVTDLYVLPRHILGQPREPEIYDGPLAEAGETWEWTLNHLEMENR
jgi:hypothetical protein